MNGNEKASLIEMLSKPKLKDTAWSEEEQKKQREKEVEGCTFKPQTLQYLNAQGIQDGDRCQHLYSKVQPGQYKDNKGRDGREQEYERAKDDCTFKPKILSQANYDQHGETVKNVKGMDKMMERLNRGRELQQQK